MPQAQSFGDGTQGYEQQLRHEVAGLADDEILALCYAFVGRRRERLRLYLDVLRRRGGERAQFAACLVCYDLARQGDVGMQTEFVVLSSTMAALAQKPQLAQALVGDDPYLRFVWELCQAALQSMGQGSAQVAPAEAEAQAQAELEALPQAQEPVPVLQLLNDADFADLELGVDTAQLWRQYDEAVEAFLGGVPGLPAYDAQAGFRYGTPRAPERVQVFLQALMSLQDAVPPGRGFYILTLLFLGTHLRSRSLFGTRNARRQQVLREGLQAWVEHGAQLYGVAGVVGPMHADADVWPKICELVLHAARWLAQTQPSGSDPWASYDPPG
jgi:hypothetical protein